MFSKLARYYLRILAYFRRDVWNIALLVLVIVVGIGVGLLQAWPTAVLVDTVLNPTPHHSWASRLFLAPLPHHILAQVIGLMVIALALKIIRDFMTLARNLVNRRIEFNGLVRVRYALFQKLQTLGPEYHTKLPQGDGLYRVTSDANGFKDIFNILLNTSFSAVRLIMMIVIMLSRSVPLTIFALSVFPVLMLINGICGPRIRRSAAESKQQETDHTTALQRSLTTLSLTQAFSRQTRDFAIFKAANLRCIGGWMRMNVNVEVYWFLLRTVFTIGAAVIFGYGGYLIYRDQFLLHNAAGFTCGDLLVFTAYLSDLWDPLTDLTSFHANIQTPLASVERVLTVLDRKPGVVDRPGAQILAVRPRVLNIEGVSYSHGEGIHALRDVSATVLPGQMVAFVGGSGGGKSTLLSMLNRWRDPQAGQISLDGHGLCDLQLVSVRRHIAWVGQESLLLPITIGQNIAFGHSSAKPAEIREAAEMAGAHEFIGALPDGYNTLLTEGAQNLSGGQRQRVAIARALLTRAPIIVLDEPTSALDAKHAAQIFSTLNWLRGKRTIILVTHDLRAVESCDQIFVLDHGRIVERGTHQQLSAVGGAYASLRAAIIENQNDESFTQAA